MCWPAFTSHHRPLIASSETASSAHESCKAAEFPRALPRLPPPRAVSTRFETGPGRRGSCFHSASVKRHGRATLLRSRTSSLIWTRWRFDHGSAGASPYRVKFHADAVPPVLERGTVLILTLYPSPNRWGRLFAGSNFTEGRAWCLIRALLTQKLRPETQWCLECSSIVSITGSTGRSGVPPDRRSRQADRLTG